MKNILHKILISLITFSVCSCSIKEDMDDCLPLYPPYQVRLEFECVEIYDKPDITFEKVTEELELLFYDMQGKLVYDLTYTDAELAETLWWVFLYEEEVQPGNYTLLALVNYNNEHYTLTGKDKLETLLAGLKYGTSKADEENSDEINFPLTDTYYGLYDLELNYNAGPRPHKVMLSKNTNFVNLTIICQDEEDYKSISSFQSRITGNNTLYDWKNKAVAAPAVKYIPYGSTFSDENKSYTDMNKTMRIWHASDINLDINFIADGNPHHEIFDIPQWMTTIDKYDTDDKLEHYDQFDIEITYSKGFVLLSVTVNGWYVVINDEDI